MIPITRKELYLNKIVGNDDYDIPEKPIIEEEFFFVEILGEAVQAPEPLTRYQLYLAKIAGKNIEIPYPETRLEYFLARAAGMDVETPVPITREEIYWSNYTATTEFELENVPPLTYKAIEGTLKNYRIYGNTVDGESVGDRTANLFDMKKFAELCYPRYASVTFADNTLSFTSKAIDAYVNTVHSENATVADEYRPSCIDVLPSTTYTISMSSAPKCYISWVDSSYKVISAYTRIPEDQSSYTFTTPSNCTKLLIRLGKVVNNIGDEFTISNIMLNAGSTALPYEPYGYEVPVTINNVTTNFYLPEPLKMVGNDAEYVDFVEQKQYFADGTSVDVELPTLPTIAGANVLAVGTEVQPSGVEIKGHIK